MKPSRLFNIILANMFNRHRTKYYQDKFGSIYYNPDDSYFVMTKWDDFCRHPVNYLNMAASNRGKWTEFDIVKKINPDWVC